MSREKPGLLGTRAIEVLKELGFESVPDSVPWREGFPEIRDEALPGVSLRGPRVKECLTQIRLSELTGIPQRHISMMENQRRPIGKKNAKLLAKILNMDYRIFL